jgi:hypothetical protein
MAPRKYLRAILRPSRVHALDLKPRHGINACWIDQLNSLQLRLDAGSLGSCEMFSPDRVTRGSFRQSDAFINELPIIICLAQKTIRHFALPRTLLAGRSWQQLGTQAFSKCSSRLLKLLPLSILCEYTSGYSISITKARATRKEYTRSMAHIDAV